MPSRRQVLAALGATGSLAGCLSRCHTPAEEIDVADPVDLSDPFDVAGAWRMVDGDPARTGRTAWTMPANTARCWCDSLGTNSADADLSRFLQGPPVVARGTDPIEPAQPYRVYVTATVWGGGGSWGTVHCLNAHTGAERWRIPFRGEAVPPPAVAGDSMVVVHELARVDDADSAERRGRVVCLRRRDGRVRWTYDIDTRFPGPPVVADGTAYVTGDHGVHALDIATGAPLWVTTLQDEDDSGYYAIPHGGVAVADGRLYLTSDASLSGVAGSGLFVLDAATGEVSARARTAELALKYGPTVTGDVVLAAGGTLDQLWAFDRRGNVRWVEELPLDRPTHPVTDGTRAYVTGDRGVGAWNLSDGSRVWHATDEQRHFGRPALAGDTLLVNQRPAGDSLLAPLHNRLVGYDAETGAKRWRVSVPNADPAAVVDGAVFLPGDDANLVAVGPCSGFFRGP